MPYTKGIQIPDKSGIQMVDFIKNQASESQNHSKTGHICKTGLVQLG
jgi:hypothetical protein